MAGLIYRLVVWELTRKPGRMLLLTLAIFGALSTYVLFGAILEDVSTQAMMMWRTEFPYDIMVEGAAVERLEAEILAVQGVIRVDPVTGVDVIIGSSPTTVLALDERTLFVLEYSEGAGPVLHDEIAIPESWLSGSDLKVGSTLRVLAAEMGSEPKWFTISGLLADKTRVPQQPIIAPVGVPELSRGASLKKRLLVVLDGKVKVDAVKNAIHGMPGGLKATSFDDQYAGVQGGMGLADTLLASMRVLILVIAASAMGVLTHLAQRERAYQSGVLRAMGLSRSWLMVAPLLEGLIVFTLGSALAYAVLPLLARPLGLLGGDTTITSLFFDQAGFFVGFGLLMVVITSLTFTFRPITSLLRDVWGK